MSRGMVALLPAAASALLLRLPDDLLAIEEGLLAAREWPRLAWEAATEEREGTLRTACAAPGEGWQKRAR